MESLLQSYRTRLDLTPTDYVRTFHNTVNWKNRLIGILGQKGVGKSTMILQHIKLFDKSLFFTLFNDLSAVFRAKNQKKIIILWKIALKRELLNPKPNTYEETYFAIYRTFSTPI